MVGSTIAHASDTLRTPFGYPSDTIMLRITSCFGHYHALDGNYHDASDTIMLSIVPFAYINANCFFVDLKFLGAQQK